MSLFEDLAQTALGALNSSGNSQGGLANLVTDLIHNHPSGNGLTGLVEQLASAGLGAQVNSWIGSGANQPVTGDQIHQALGPEKISALAQQAGIPSGQLADALAHALPQIIDRLTPNGEVPQGGGLQAAIGGVLQSDWFRGLTAPR